MHVRLDFCSLAPSIATPMHRRDASPISYASLAHAAQPRHTTQHDTQPFVPTAKRVHARRDDDKQTTQHPGSPADANFTHHPLPCRCCISARGPGSTEAKRVGPRETGSSSPCTSAACHPSHLPSSFSAPETPFPPAFSRERNPQKIDGQLFL